MQAFTPTNLLELNTNKNKETSPRVLGSCDHDSHALHAKIMLHMPNHASHNSHVLHDLYALHAQLTMLPML